MDITKECQVIKVIRTTLTGRGKGKEGSVYRKIEQFWSLDGELLAENDPILQKKIDELDLLKEDKYL